MILVSMYSGRNIVFSPFVSVLHPIKGHCGQPSLNAHSWVNEIGLL